MRLILVIILLIFSNEILSAPNMNRRENSSQGIEAKRYLLTWFVPRVDILYFVYRCLDVINSTHEPLERTSQILESLFPEFNSEKEDNDQNVVEVREDRVFRPMQFSGRLSWILVGIFFFIAL